ncbi:uncharacterized protein L3040_002784 [Drepanopeziza brunnea f. sp. 'multigermtubi']|uniref:uncharacterized protein n=1 Tax=Drepanopeziza brunnea f. sp. 'multigermtubi' TaxID=698441 RepID=UPI0023A1A206|nr:hypothetical protein L3040_002784 [Drepanopeziza brunnea f. sp. 'multigermtubi']
MAESKVSLIDQVIRNLQPFLSDRNREDGTQDPNINMPPQVSSSPGAQSNGGRKLETVTNIPRPESKSEAEAAKSIAAMLNVQGHKSVEDLPVHLGLGTRLDAGTNHERKPDDDLPAISQPHHHHQQITTREYLLESSHSRRALSKEIDIEACAREGDLKYKGEDQNQGPSAADEVGEMSERSSGTKRQTRNSSQSQARFAESTGPVAYDTDTLGTVDDEGKKVKEVVAEQFFPVISVRRVTPPPRDLRSAQKQSAEKQRNTAGSVDLTKEEINASSPEAHDDKAHDDKAHDDKAATKSDDALESQSEWRRRMQIRYFGTSTCAPDYGPIASAPKSAKEVEEVEEMPRNLGGGVQPINRLANKTTIPANKSLKPKTFDLTSGPEHDASRQPPSKRQRVEGTTHGTAIDIEETPQPSSHRATSSQRSGHSRERNGSGRTFSLGERRVPEQQKVESFMKVPRGRKDRKKRANGSTERYPSAASRQNTEEPFSALTGSLDKPPTVISGPHRFSNSFIERHQDNADDPIFDEETETVSTSKKAGPMSNRDTGPKFQDASSHEFTLKPKFSGNTRLRQAQENFKAGPSRTSTGETSWHFADPGPRGMGVSSLHSVSSSAVPIASRAAKQQINKSDHDSEIDELVDPDLHPAHELLKSHKIQKQSPANSNEENSRKQSFTVDESSEDETGKSADIAPTKYGSSKTKAKNVLGEELYKVSQFFSESNDWLLKELTRSGVLKHDKNSGLLAFAAEDTPRIEFSSNKVERIESCRTSSKMVIHKPRDQDGAPKLYIEFGSSDLCQQLYEELKSIHPNIRAITRMEEYLDNAFKHVPSKLHQRKSRQALLSAEPDDLRLAKANSQRRQKANGLWDRGPRISEKHDDAYQQEGKPVRGTRVSAGLAKKMGGCPDSPDLLKGPHVRKNDELSALTFYGDSSRATPKESFARKTRSREFSSHGAPSAPAPRQPRLQRSPTPDPPRWTVQNKGWEKKYWPNGNSVIYPSEGKNKASVDRQDIERLDEGEFLNDNLIVFYLRWLEHRLGQERPDLAKRIYFHNTFFYERLTKSARGKPGGINHEAVARWTSKVDLLQYDYIVIPVNETVHWYVAIICNAPKLLEECSKEAPSPPIQNKTSEDESKEPRSQDGSTSRLPSPQYLPGKLPASDSSIAVDTNTMDLSLENYGKKSPVRGGEHDRNLINDAPGAVEGTGLEIDDAPPANITSDVMPDPTNAPPANVVSDLPPDLIETDQSQTKQVRRRSTAPIRKYDPTEPRIITLDSLGIAHSPTCSNLKKYLIQEIKDKKNIEIKDPGNLGMTAKGIPQQDNHCDCGLFLLTYIEQFLQKPDQFIEGILQGSLRDYVTIDDDQEWPPASKMRNDIRELLFDLQRKQAEAEAERKAKAKSKKASKTPEKDASALTSNTASREASKSNGTSPVPDEAQISPGRFVAKPVQTLENSEKRQRSKLAVSPENGDSELLDPSGLAKLDALEAPTEEAARALFGGLDKDSAIILGAEGAPYEILDDSTQDVDANEALMPAKRTTIQMHSDRLGQRKQSQSAKRSREKEEIPDSQEDVPEYRVLHHPPPLSSPHEIGENEWKKGKHKSFSSPTSEQEHSFTDRLKRSRHNAMATGRLESPSHLSEEHEESIGGELHEIQEHNVSVAEDDELQLVSTTPKIQAGVGGHASATQEGDDVDWHFSKRPPPDASLLESSSPPVAYSQTPTTAKRGREDRSEDRSEDRRALQLSPATVKKQKRDDGNPRQGRRRSPFKPLERRGPMIRDPSDLQIIGSSAL